MSLFVFAKLILPYPECGHTRIACRFVRFRYMAQKNGGHAFLICSPYERQWKNTLSIMGGSISYGEKSNSI